MNSQRLSICVIAAAGALALAAPAAAYTLIHPPTFSQIVAGSSLAVRGRVTEVSQRGADIGLRSPFPYQKITVQVERGYVGAAAGTSISFFQYGGAIPSTNRSVTASALPVYAPGDRVALFLNDTKFPMLGTMFGDLGVRRIVTLGDGTDVVLGESWRPTVRDSEGRFRLTDDYLCVPLSTDRGRCQRWLPRQAGESSSQGEPSLPWMRTGDLDVEVNTILSQRPPSSAPPQTVGKNEAAFVEKLRAWRGPHHRPNGRPLDRQIPDPKAPAPDGEAHGQEVP